MLARVTRFSALFRLFAIVMLVSTMILAGVGAGPMVTGPLVAFADDDDDDDDGGNATGGNGTGGNGTGGEGGQSDDESKDKKTENEKDKGKDDPADDDQGQGNDDDPGQGQALGQGGPVTRAPDYRVVVECAAIDGEARTACMFLGLLGDRVGEGDVVRIAAPEAEVCAGVVGGSVEGDSDGDDVDDAGDGKLLRADSGVGESAYVAESHALLLILDAEVTTVDAGTYWVWDGNQNVYPATGPGLQCREAEAPAAPTEAPKTTGSLVIRAFLCEPGIATGDDIDWYGACAEPALGASFAIEESVVGTAGPALTGTVDDDGRWQVDDLDPGAYSVEQTDGNWCHAESDNVNDAGEVMVEADEEATIWVFDCQ